jgi:UDP-N-acetylmuramoyl-tripeptide--D-alanyl-D-alanine ligase
VTTVAPAHLEAFGAIEGIAHEKAAIYEGLAPGGIALAHADIETAPILFEKARACGAMLIRFGTAEGVEARLLEAAVGDGGTAMLAEVQGRAHRVSLGAPGRHLAMNALIALAAAGAAGADVARAARALEGWAPVAGRGTRARIVLPGARAIEVIDDAFNANPASVAAALEVLAAATPEPGGRRIAVLGDMLELGAAGPALHAAIADHPGLAWIDMVHCVGPMMAHLHGALPEARRGVHCDTAEAMAEALPPLLRGGDVVLLKGSKGIRVARVVDALRNLGQSLAGRTRGSP